MVKSKTIDYKDKSGEGLTKNPIIKIMQMVWRFVTAVIKAARKAKST